MQRRELRIRLRLERRLARRDGLGLLLGRRLLRLGDGRVAVALRLLEVGSAKSLGLFGLALAQSLGRLGLSLSRGLRLLYRLLARGALAREHLLELRFQLRARPLLRGEILRVLRASIGELF